MLTSIILLTHNQLDYTKLCIESIRKHTKQAYEIIVVDNASTDGTKEWLKKQKDIRLILNEENKGFPAGCNQGAKIAKGDAILFLNNDTMVTNKWLENLTACLNSATDVGAVGPVTNNSSYYQAIEVSYKSIEEMEGFAVAYNKTNPDQWEQRIKLVGFCMLVKREVLEKVGFFDERFSPGNFEDDDLSFRMVLAGYKIFLCRDTFIHHFGSVSFKENIDKYRCLLTNNKEKFEEKWKFDPQYSLFIRDEVINLLKEDPKKSINVLEVGCACGASLLKIKHVYPNAQLFGIELNAAASQIASQFASVSAQDIESGELSFEESFFDYIIFADVLEHLRDPETVLKCMKRYLKKSGRLIASIPNVMHISVVRNLLAGHWTYENAGILDKTHLRFFTLNEINKMFLNAGYDSMEYQSIESGRTEDDTKSVKALLAIVDSSLENQFFAYQYLVSAKVADEENDGLFVKQKIATACEDKSRNEVLFPLRRIENDIDRENSISKMIGFLKCNKKNLKIIEDIILRSIIKKEEVVNFIAVKAYNDKEVNTALELLEFAYKINPNNPITVYNLASIMDFLGESTTALTFLRTIKEPDGRIKELLGEIEGKLNGRK